MHILWSHESCLSETRNKIKLQRNREVDKEKITLIFQPLKKKKKSLVADLSECLRDTVSQLHPPTWNRGDRKYNCWGSTEHISSFPTPSPKTAVNPPGFQADVPWSASPPATRHSLPLLTCAAVLQRVHKSFRRSGQWHGELPLCILGSHLLQAASFLLLVPKGGFVGQMSHIEVQPVRCYHVRLVVRAVETSPQILARRVHQHCHRWGMRYCLLTLSVIGLALRENLGLCSCINKSMSLVILSWLKRCKDWFGIKLR